MLPASIFSSELSPQQGHNFVLRCSRKIESEKVVNFALGCQGGGWGFTGESGDESFGFHKKDPKQKSCVEKIWNFEIPNLEEGNLGNISNCHPTSLVYHLAKMRMTAEVIRHAPKYVNPLKERHLSLRGTSFKTLYAW